MYQSNWSFNISPGQPPEHLNFWRLVCSNSLPSGQKSRSNAPPISTEIPLLNEKFRLQSNTVHAFQGEICRDDTLKLLLQTVLRVLFTNKGEILSWKSVKPCKNRKNSQAYFARTWGKSDSNSPPFQGNVQIPPSRDTMHSQMPGLCPGGGDVEASIWPVHNGEYWPEVVTVRTSLRSVRTKTTEGQYSSVRSRASEVSK